MLIVYALSYTIYDTFIKVSANRLVLFGATNAITIALALILIWFVPLPNAESVPFFFITAFCYNFGIYFTAKSMHRIDFSVFTPLRAALRFLFIILFAKLVLEEQAYWYEWVGISGVLIGLLSQTDPKLMFNKNFLYALVMIIIAALASAGQFSSDAYGIKVSDNPFSYIIWLMFIGLPTTIVAFVKHRKDIAQLLHNERRQIIGSSLLDNIGYAAFLYVVYKIKILYALPVGNISIVMATLVGLFFLKETLKKRRIVSAVIIALSIAFTQIMATLY